MVGIQWYLLVLKDGAYCLSILHQSVGEDMYDQDKVSPSWGKNENVLHGHAT